ncbi:hypothetical protein GLX27_002526 [Malassezia furfur]|uniref:Uncharacterized protein n=1 Tax=Malassezia furfur TaxID=55194 RepID=A0ABY8EQT0_MALFU|nr:hypothetical protein GLX27_002526 [Malassezia furfur]
MTAKTMQSANGGAPHDPSVVLAREPAWTSPPSYFPQFQESGDEYTRLYAELVSLGDVPTQQETNKRDLWKISGSIETASVVLKRAQDAAAKRQAAYDKSAKAVLVRLVPALQRRSRNMLDLKAELTAAIQARDAAQAKVDADVARQAELERTRDALVSARARYDALRTQLQMLGARIFPPETVSAFPVLETLRWEVELQSALHRLIPTEIDRERRARQALKFADKHVEDCLKLIRTILQLGMKMGVPQNNKHHQKLFSGSALAFADQSMPRLLSCKSSLGEFHTCVARARIRQKMVHRAPTFELVDLSKLPGRRRVGAMDEMTMYAHMEASYAQCQFCRTYITNEIRTSFAREKAMQEQQSKMGEAIEAATSDVRAAQNTILTTYTRGVPETQAALEKQFGEHAVTIRERTQKALARNASDAAEEAKDEEEARETDAGSTRASTLPPYPTSDVVSVLTYAPVPGMSPQLYEATRALLHVLLAEIDAQTRVEDTEEDLPWHPGALGW